MVHGDRDWVCGANLASEEMLPGVFDIVRLQRDILNISVESYMRALASRSFAGCNAVLDAVITPLLILNIFVRMLDPGRGRWLSLRQAPA